MKTLLILVSLLIATLLFPGCYTVLLVEPTVEVVSSSQDPISTYIPEPYPIPEPPMDCMYISSPPPPCPDPLTYISVPVHVNDNPTSTPPSTDDRRLTHTGRGPLDANPAPARNDENNTGTRDSGVRRGGR